MRDEALSVAGGNRGAADDLGKIDAAQSKPSFPQNQDLVAGPTTYGGAAILKGDLSDLAQAIDAAYDVAFRSAQSAIEAAVECGRLLLQAKGKLGHGEWLPWLEANTKVSARQSQKYMRLAKYEPGSHLSINEALAALADNSPLKHPLPYGSHSGHVEWYTPPRYLECARQVLGEFDVDPASSDIAQKQVRARAYFTVEDGGLAQQWNGRVWCNPPYSDTGKWVDKLLTELSASRATEAMLLVNGYTDAKWFHRAAAKCAAICFPQGRVPFVDPDGEPGQPAYGSAFFYFGDRVDRFREAFAGLGTIMLPAGAPP